ncbi:MAG: hypothetical protein AB7G25_07300 [Sphingomonadaceae bacterium]
MEESSAWAASFWGVAIVIGPIVLALVLLWVTLHNRQTRRERERSEDATRKLYEQSDRESKRRDE